MSAKHLSTCTLCEAGCGIVVTTDGERVVDIRGDDDDPRSQGYICPKATALADLHHDPDRLRRPMLRDGGEWREIPWDEAFARAGEGLSRIREQHGPDALGVYYGNPTAHNLGLLTYGLALTRTLGTRNVYSASSADQFPQMLAAQEMFGHVGLMPVPDVDRTDLFVIVGANPLVSNGSIMTAPDMKRRLKAIRERGGRVVVIDPRRTETAELASEHVFVRPGTDAHLLLGLAHVLFAEKLVRLGALAPHVVELEALGTLAKRFPPDAVSGVTGVPAATIVRLARDLAAARRAAIYGRVGACTQEHGTLTSWLVYALSVITGRLDCVGGSMLTTPAVEVLPVLEALGMARGYARWKSRVRGLPEFIGEFPVATLADEIETEGPGQVRALLTMAGNPALSAPNGRRLERALGKLDFMVSIDGYLNETTRHATLVLPPVSQLSRSHYDLALNAFSVRNFARYDPPVFPKKADERHDWEIALELMLRVLVPAPLRGAMRAAALASGPEAILDAGLRVGPHGVRRGPLHALSLSRLKKSPHGIDLGPLEPQLPERLGTPDRRLHVAPALFVKEAERLEADLSAPRDEHRMVLIGRRHLRSNNSWMHNSQRLVKGPRRCTLLVHPEDAKRLGLHAGAMARVRSRVGEVLAEVEISDEIMRGVVSLPHGWGHDRKGTRLRVAEQHAGVSVNDVTDDAFLDRLTGTAGFSGVAVEVEPAVRAEIASTATA